MFTWLLTRVIVTRVGSMVTTLATAMAPRSPRRQWDRSSSTSPEAAAWGLFSMPTSGRSRAATRRSSRCDRRTRRVYNWIPSKKKGTTIFFNASSCVVILWEILKICNILEIIVILSNVRNIGNIIFSAFPKIYNNFYLSAFS